MAAAKTLFDKIWQRHCVEQSVDGDTLLYVDRCLIHEGSNHAFDKIQAEGRRVARPSQVFAFSDHYVPTTNRHLGIAGVNDPAIRGMIAALADNSRAHGIRLFGIDDPQQGILHVVPPELGMTQPGLLLVGADSHTSTQGALGAFSFGIGASETAHVLATQTIWQRRPRNMRIAVDGTLPFGCTGKDIILAIIALIGAGGGTGHAIEFAGSAIRDLSLEARMTVCNMTIEAGGRTGMVAPDDTTYAYLKGREYAPKGEDWDKAVDFWRNLPTDADAHFDRELSLSANDITPMVTWGTSPEHALPITAVVPDPAALNDADARVDAQAALDYMDLRPGTPLESIAVSRVFIGSCTNGRLEDIRAVAAVAKRGTAKVPTWVVPGSGSVKRAAEAEGLHHVLQAAGFEWRDPGCSLCTAINGDILLPGERCASTSNRNFRGRQGKGGRTHLLSPSMAAAAAITGHLSDVRKLAG